MADDEKIRIRPDVWRLPEGDQTLHWYAKAMEEMKKRPIEDPTSWRYQGAIHGYERQGDPYFDPQDRLPSETDQRRFWRQCQHGSWYFLPWHRMYLGYFERIVAATVVQLGGPVGWSLPYWNYSDAGNPDARRIPAAFREPADSRNPLWVEPRTAAANSGDVVAMDSDVAIVDCLDETVFAGTALGGTSGFGGPQAGVNHEGGLASKLEMTPHGDMHGAVGGPSGFMSWFHTAALDPLFWLHHANIDRLWTVWNLRKPTNTNPTERQWLDAPKFDFHDESRAAVTLTCRAVADSAASLFRYRYADESDPLAAAKAHESVESAAEVREEAFMPNRLPAEMIGASESALRLEGHPVTTRLQLQAPTGPAAERELAVESVEANVAAGRVHLSIENIRGSAPIPHLVYLGLLPGEAPEAHPEKLAGSLPMFGLPEASREDSRHPGSGLSYSLDVTRVVQRLGSLLPPEELEVTIVPKVALPLDSAGETEAAESAFPTIEIGRISVYRGG